MARATPGVAHSRESADADIGLQVSQLFSFGFLIHQGPKMFRGDSDGDNGGHFRGAFASPEFSNSLLANAHWFLPCPCNRLCKPGVVGSIPIRSTLFPDSSLYFMPSPFSPPLWASSSGCWREGSARIFRERYSWPLPRKPERSVEGRRAALLARSRLPVAGSHAKIKADA